MADDPQVVEKLFAVFAATDAAGAPLYPMADLAHFLPWILVNMPVDLGALDDATIAIFAETCAKAGVTADDPPDVLQDKMAAYYAENPPNPALAAALQAAWREANQTAGAANPFAKFAGDSRKTQVLESGARPAGTVAAGPMARFQVKDPPPRK